jgi:DNA modification methylase
MPAEELLFQPTPGFGSYYEPYLDHAKSHPAKMNMWLLEWLIKAFTKPGETVLDPMAGSGSMGVVAALHGRNAVQVELEKKFYDWMEKAKGNIEKNAAIQQKGWIKNILGDARCLSQLLRDVDICITSPPYAETHTGGGDPEKRRKRLIKAGHNPKDFLGGKARNAVLKHYTEVDTVITSPPYSESMTKRRKGYTVIPELKKTREMPQDTKDDNIANLPHGTVAAIITSPPYERQHQGGYDTPKIRHGCIKERRRQNWLLYG